ncbi:MAG: biopolymer transporter ExbD [Elusimicrobiota bacterium]
MNNLSDYSLRRNKKMPEINMAPMVDIVFQLIIFFLVAATFTLETGVTVRKPKASTASEVSRESIFVAVTKEGTIHINKRQVDRTTLNKIIKDTLGKTADRPVVIIADKDSLTGTVIEVIKLSQKKKHSPERKRIKSQSRDLLPLNLFGKLVLNLTPRHLQAK